MLRPATKTIQLLLCGPVREPGRSGVPREIRTQDEVTAWLQQMPELSLLGSVQGRVLTHRADADQQYLQWQEIAGIVAQQYSSSDGFVVFLPQDAVAYTSAALCLMLRSNGKPVIITALQEPQEPEEPRRGRPPGAKQDLNIRALFVNAVQFATLHVGGVAVLQGNALYRAATYVPASSILQPVLRQEKEVVGTIDFGLKVAPHRPHRAHMRLQARTALKPRVAHFVLAPNSVIPLPEELRRHKLDGMLVSLIGMDVPRQLTALAAELRHEHIATALYTPIGLRRRPNGIHVVARVTPHMAVVKFMWALGQERTFSGVQRLLDTDIAGERQLVEGDAP